MKKLQQKLALGKERGSRTREKMNMLEDSHEQIRCDRIRYRSLRGRIRSMTLWPSHHRGDQYQTSRPPTLKTSMR